MIKLLLCLLFGHKIDHKNIDHSFIIEYIDAKGPYTVSTCPRCYFVARKNKTEDNIFSRYV